MGTGGLVCLLIVAVLAVAEKLAGTDQPAKVPRVAIPRPRAGGNLASQSLNQVCGRY
jgi:hypothetical protein